MSVMRRFHPISILAAISAAFLALPSSRSDQNIFLAEVPDYSWFAGCFGTSGGNLIGYWDRHGFPGFYTGPTAGGVAPLNSVGANRAIRSLWASQAGLDGRPADQPGHIDDYWTFFEDDTSYSYESTEPDPYVLLGRPEHPPDCLGDFMGASQNKWDDLDGECSGNIDAFGFNFWDKTGARRWNFTPPVQNGEPVRDIQSGLRLWTESRGESAHVFSQLADFNPNIPPGTGFTFEDLKAEIDAGYPVMLFLQNPDQLSRNLDGMPRANPRVHAMIAYGYAETDAGGQAVRYRTSWADGDNSWAPWGSQTWETLLTLRGVIGYRPLPRITSVQRQPEGIRVTWNGPLSSRVDALAGAQTTVHSYVLERAGKIEGPYMPVTEPLAQLEAVIPDCCEGQTFFRVKLLHNSTPAI